MTRKRYVKLLMSTGASRNLANRSADDIARRGDSYVNNLLVITQEVPEAIKKAMAEALMLLDKILFAGYE